MDGNAPFVVSDAGDPALPVAKATGPHFCPIRCIAVKAHGTFGPDGPTGRPRALSLLELTLVGAKSDRLQSGDYEAFRAERAELATVGRDHAALARAGWL